VERAHVKGKPAREETKTRKKRKIPKNEKNENQETPRKTEK
jgi:hypothetical protein